MPIVDGADVRLNYFVVGEGTPATFLHGFTQSGRSWQDVISTMPQGWRWVVPDLRGHGETQTSQGAGFSMEACAADLEMLWDELSIEHTHLVGYSMGGRLALHVAARRQSRLTSILTIGAHGGLDEDAREGRRRDDEALAQRIEREGIEAFVDYWSALPMFAGLEQRGPTFVAELRAQRLRNSVSGLAASLRGMGAGVMDPVWRDLARMGVPGTFVAGHHDDRYVAFARRLASAVPKGRVEIVPRAGHAVHLEQPDHFAGVLQAHLEGTEAVSSSTSV